MEPLNIQNRIHEIRGQKVMLDYDLAELYQVATKALNQAVKRNSARFPEDFMFRLTGQEWAAIRSQIVTASEAVPIRSQNATASASRRNVSAAPFAFTEHGVTMLASVLRSERAVKMSIAVVRAFIALKSLASANGSLAQQLQALADRVGEHDAQLNQIYDAIENLLDKEADRQAEAEAWKNRQRIGFKK